MIKEELVMSRVSVENIQESYITTSLHAKEEIKHLIHNLDGDDIDIDIVLREGKASEEIVELSEIITPDLIIMGSNGRDSLSDYILGTTTTNVVDKTSYPLLVIPSVNND